MFILNNWAHDTGEVISGEIDYKICVNVHEISGDINGKICVNVYI